MNVYVLEISDGGSITLPALIDEYDEQTQW